MVNYQDGKIYKIVDNTNGNIYVGSTTQKYLSRRLAKHRGHYKEFLKGTGGKCLSFDIIKNGDYKIILICSYPCNNNDELRKKEQEYIDEYDCVNKFRAYNSKKDKKNYNDKYYELKKEEHLKYKKEYYILNKEKILRDRKILSEYQVSWGGRISNPNCCLLKINPFLFQ